MRTLLLLMVLLAGCQSTSAPKAKPRFTVVSQQTVTLNDYKSQISVYRDEETDREIAIFTTGLYGGAACAVLLPKKEEDR